MAAFDVRIARESVSPGYRLGLLLVAVMMLILPLGYLGMIGVVGYGVYWYATHNFNSWMLHDGRLVFLFYVCPLASGVVLLLFMIKPMIARRPEESVTLNVRREDEPLLFEFIHRLCRTLGAPVPSRIDVVMDANAAASFRRGWRGMLGKNLVLTIGLPLAGGLDVRQFAGVLAHELGHFSQGSGMRLTYIIRSIESWFARAVYQRDLWDLRLMILSRRSGHWLLTLIALCVRFMVWLTRRVLWCLLWAGHITCSFMMRQMEFDADGYECRVAGSATFGSTGDRLRALSVATKMAFSDLNDAWRERRLCDDLPALICAREQSMPAEVRQTIRKQADERKTKWFDSHPSDSARRAAAEARNEPGLFKIDAPARVLFGDFAALCRIASMTFYKTQIGEAFTAQKLVTTQKMVQSHAQQRQTFTALQRFFRNLIDSERMVFPAMPGTAPQDRAAAGEQLLALRSKLCELEPFARDATEACGKATRRATLLTLARELRTAGIRKCGAKDPSIDLMSNDALEHDLKKTAAARDAAGTPIDRALAVCMQRLELALALSRPAPLEAPEPADVAPEEDFGEYDLAAPAPAGTGDSQLDAIMVLRRTHASITVLRGHALSLNVLLRRIKPMDNSRALADAILWHASKALALLHELFNEMAGAVYPYSVDGRAVPLNRYLINALPPKDEIGAIAKVAISAVDAYFGLYMRLMSDLAHRAEKMETELGLPPLDDPVSAAVIEPDADGDSGELVEIT